MAKKRGRPSKAELAERAAKQAEMERMWAEMEARHQEAIRVTQPHLDAINNILDNIEGLGSYACTWNDRYRSNEVLSENRIAIHSADFGGGLGKNRFYRIYVYFDHNVQEFKFNLSQSRMGDLDDETLEELINQTNNIKPMMAKIKNATDKVLDYAKANGIELY